LLPGQTQESKIVIIEDQKFLIMECQGMQSEQINIEGLENSYSSVQTSLGLLETAINIRLIQHQNHIVTKQVCILPRYNISIITRNIIPKS